MPLMKPEVQEVLRAAGLAPNASKSAESGSISDKLDRAGLSLEETLEQLAFIAKESGNESLRARCLETVLKAHGALKETAAAPPSFTIVIQEAAGAPVPPAINPILLPRQLLKQLNDETTKIQ